jgi:hypothetical protein
LSLHQVTAKTALNGAKSASKAGEAAFLPNSPVWTLAPKSVELRLKLRIPLAFSIRNIRVMNDRALHLGLEDVWNHDLIATNFTFELPNSAISEVEIAPDDPYFGALTLSMEYLNLHGSGPTSIS